MTNEEVEHIIMQQGQAAASRQSQLLRLIIVAFSFVVAITLVFSVIVFLQSRTINDLSDVISNRSPVLDYLQCYNDLEVNNNILEAYRNKTQTDYLLGLVDAGPEPSNEALVKVAQLRSAYAEAESTYQEAVRNEEDLAKCGRIPKGD